MTPLYLNNIGKEIQATAEPWDASYPVAGSVSGSLSLLGKKMHIWRSGLRDMLTPHRHYPAV